MYQRIKNFQNLKNDSCFFWGPRQTGKSTLLKSLFPEAQYYDLLLSEEFSRLNRHPEFFRQEVLSLSESEKKLPVIVDEIQKIPILLNEVQWLMDNEKIKFILCGSSARKLKREGVNLLGGRAIIQELYPLVSKEISDFDLIRGLNHGFLPSHYLAENPEARLKAYVGTYLKEEILEEALTRNVAAFSRFLEVAAFSNAEIVNFKNIASDSAVSAQTVKEYFQILEDTLIGYFVQPFRKRAKRRVVQSPKFYFFDVGLANILLNRKNIQYPSEVFGKAFEHFIFQELKAHSHYCGLDYEVSYWRTSSGLEVDFILADGQVAVEVKGRKEVLPRHLKGLRVFSQDYKPKKSIVVSLDSRPREIAGIKIIPWQNFLEDLWGGKIIK